MIDSFSHFADTPTAPASHCFAILPDDDAPLERATKAIYVGMGGDLAVEPLEGETVVFRNLPDGGMIDVRARRILATGTTAADLVALA